MVWVMALPSGFGDFGPEGHFVGWEEARTHFANEVDGDSYGYGVWQKFIEEQGKQFSPRHPPIAAIESHEAPKWYELERRYSSLGSTIRLQNGILAVDEALKEIIERMEPHRHQFFPIQITMPRNVAYPKRYFILVIGQYLESFSPVQSVEGSWEPDGSTHYFYNSPRKKDLSGLALSKTIFGTAHLWRERLMSLPLICFSEVLLAEIVKAGLRLPQHFQAKEV